MSSSPRSFKTVSEYLESRTSDPGADQSDELDQESQPDSLPGSIEAALACFDVEAANAATNSPRSSGGIAQFMSREIKSSDIPAQVITVPRMAAVPPRTTRSTPVAPASAVDRDESGRVTSVRFGGGDVAEFSYDQSGSVAAFTYAGLTWLHEEAGYWRSGDRQIDYRIDGEVAVLHDGSIRITRVDVTRTLKTTGVRIDEHRDGSRTESRKMRNAPTPFDLLAKSKPVSSVWLSSASPSRDHDRIQSIQLFESNDDEMDHSRVVDGLITSSRNRMFTSETVIPTSKVESNLRSMDAHKSAKGVPFVQEPQVTTANRALPAETSMLRNAVSRLPEEKENRSFGEWLHSFKRDTSEYALKAILWTNDMMRGPASPCQLPFLDALANIYTEKQQNDDAETMHLRSLHIKETYYGMRQPELAVNVSGLAEIYRRRHNFARAEQMYKEAMRLHEKSVRKNLFLFSQGVFEESRLTREVDALFRCIRGLADTYDSQKKYHATRDLHEIAMGLWGEISDKANHKLDAVLEDIIDRYVAIIKTKSKESQKRTVTMIPTAS